MLFVPAGRLVEKVGESLIATAQTSKLNLASSIRDILNEACDNIPTSRLKAAGFKSSKEPSSFSGVLHFWQYIISVHHFIRKNFLKVYGKVY
jgi:hypothetical protein